MSDPRWVIMSHGRHHSNFAKFANFANLAWFILPLAALSVPSFLQVASPQQDKRRLQEASSPEPTVVQDNRENEPEEIKRFTLPLEKYQQAVAYARARYRLYFLGVIYGLAAVLVILRFRVAPRFRNRAERLSSRRFAQAMVFSPLLVGSMALLWLPIEVGYHGLARTYEQSIQTWPSWAWDWTKGLMVEIVLGTVLTWIIYAVIRRSPRRWWFGFWLLLQPIVVLLVYISPWVMDPMFYRFEPLSKTHPELVGEIGKVTRRGGFDIPRTRMFLMRAGEKRRSVNAYMTGLGTSKRVVVWDTTLEKMTTPQVLAVFGHEMGHYVLGHVPRSLAFASLLLLIFLYGACRLLLVSLRHWGEKWAIRGPDDWASLPILILLLTLSNFLMSPLINAYSRH